MNNCHSTSEKTVNKGIPAFVRRYSSVFGFIIFFIPKCPLCIAAYSGVAAICGTSALVIHHPDNTDWRAYIALAVSILITGFILFTNRARLYYIPTIVAALCGLLLICISLSPGSSAVPKSDAMACYYFGAALLVITTFVYSGIPDRLFQRLKINGFAN